MTPYATMHTSSCPNCGGTVRANSESRLKCSWCKTHLEPHDLLDYPPHNHNEREAYPERYMKT